MNAPEVFALKAQLAEQQERAERAEAASNRLLDAAEKARERADAAEEKLEAIAYWMSDEKWWGMSDFRTRREIQKVLDS